MMSSYDDKVMNESECGDLNFKAPVKPTNAAITDGGLFSGISKK